MWKGYWTHQENRENHRQQHHKNRSVHVATIGALAADALQQATDRPKWRAVTTAARLRAQ